MTNHLADELRGILADDTGLPWLRTPDGHYRRPADCADMLGEPNVALPEAYLDAEFGPLHTVADDGIDPWEAG